MTADDHWVLHRVQVLQSTDREERIRAAAELGDWPGSFSSDEADRAAEGLVLALVDEGDDDVIEAVLNTLSAIHHEGPGLTDAIIEVARGNLSDRGAFRYRDYLWLIDEAAPREPE